MHPNYSLNPRNHQCPFLWKITSWVRNPDVLFLGEFYQIVDAIFINKITRFEDHSEQCFQFLKSFYSFQVTLIFINLKISFKPIFILTNPKTIRKGVFVFSCIFVMLTFIKILFELLKICILDYIWSFIFCILLFCNLCWVILDSFLNLFYTFSSRYCLKF